MNHAGQSGSGAPGLSAENQSIRGGIDGGAIVRRLAGSGPTGNGNDPRPEDDQAEIVTVAGVTLCITQRGNWYTGPGRPGVLRRCDRCGREYEARRSTSRFCSAGCRVAWYVHERDRVE